MLFHSEHFRCPSSTYKNGDEMLTIPFKIQYVIKGGDNLVPDFGIQGVETSSQL